MWKLTLNLGGVDRIARRHEPGRPVQYGYAASGLRLDDYQTSVGSVPGWAEMASAGRAFTWEMLFRLRRRRIRTASLVLHTGLSSYMDDAIDAGRPPAEEEYEIPSETVAKIRDAKAAGARVIAVGTTVVRALESAALSGEIKPGHAYTRLRIGPIHALKVADGILTGLHEPEATHLDMLSAFLPEAALLAAYNEAIERGYLWHEFGDLNLIA